MPLPFGVKRPLVEPEDKSLLCVQGKRETDLSVNLKRPFGTSLVAQWWRLHLQQICVRSLAQEEPTYLGATKPVCHNYRTCALEPRLLSPQALSTLESALHNKRCHCSESLSTATNGSPCSMQLEKRPHSTTKNK